MLTFFRRNASGNGGGRMLYIKKALATYLYQGKDERLKPVNSFSRITSAIAKGIPSGK